MKKDCCSEVRATEEWCLALPKADLHAHLSGSISVKSIQRLLDRPGNEDIKKRAGVLLASSVKRTLKQCFDLFPIIHDLITDPETLHRIVLEVLDDFASENTVYLELRTTPRASQFFTAHLYLVTVLRAVDQYHKENPDGLVCRILVSLSRHLPVAEAMGTITIVRELRNDESHGKLSDLIVGVELSGNPHKGSWTDFAPLLADVRMKMNLPVSLHLGEVLNDEEANAMLDFKPDRIGHAVLISSAVADRIINEETSLGVEVCIASNLATNSVQSVDQHFAVQRLIPSSHPCCICTDDCGVFDTTLSKEYGRLLQYLNLSREQVTRIALTGLGLWFCKDSSAKLQVLRNFRTLVEKSCLVEGHSCMWISKLMKDLAVIEPFNSRSLDVER